MASNKDTLIAASAAAISASALTYILTTNYQSSKSSSSSSSSSSDNETYTPATKRRTQILTEADVRSIEKLKDVQEKTQSEEKPPIGTKIPLSIDDIYLWEVEHLENYHSPEGHGILNVMATQESRRVIENSRASVNAAFWNPKFLKDDDDDGDDEEGLHNGDKVTLYNKIITKHECILSKIVRKPGDKKSTPAYVRAGPRKDLFFDPARVNAAIVTCGGLCPGLNNVVREITHSLLFMYGIGGKVYGVRGGYKGFHGEDGDEPIVLTPEVIENIHHEGGTVLGSSRGGFDLEKIIGFIKKYDIQQLYVIGGDGTHRGAFRIHEGCLAAGLKVAVAGIPKTIDNDVAHIDRSFGFASAVEASQIAIRTAKTEARCNLPNGIGIVKLMGRSAGFIAVHATMGSGDVDLCLVPEVPLVLEGENGCMPHLMRAVKRKGYAVVVVAEGAGEEILGTSAEVDASGNKKLPAIGEFLKSETTKYFKKHGEDATVKFIDPSYMIRSVPANATDSLYCMQLGQNAVHGAMAGFTGFSVGLCNNKMVYLPIPELCASSPRTMNPRGRTWERVLAMTLQPNTVVPLKPGEKDVYESDAPMLR